MVYLRLRAKSTRLTFNSRLIHSGQCGLLGKCIAAEIAELADQKLLASKPAPETQTHYEAPGEPPVETAVIGD